MPKSVLLALLRDRHCFDESVFTMPICNGVLTDFVGVDFIREVTELSSDDEGHWRYVWGKINNTHIPSNKVSAFLNGARQNNVAAQSSAILKTRSNTALLEHFFGTAEPVRCTDVWFIAYGKISAKYNSKGSVVEVRENWALYVHTKAASTIEIKEQNE